MCYVYEPFIKIYLKKSRITSEKIMIVKQKYKLYNDFVQNFSYRSSKNNENIGYLYAYLLYTLFIC